MTFIMALAPANLKKLPGLRMTCLRILVLLLVLQTTPAMKTSAHQLEVKSKKDDVLIALSGGSNRQILPKH